MDGRLDLHFVSDSPDLGHCDDGHLIRNLTSNVVVVAIAAIGIVVEVEVETVESVLVGSEEKSVATRIGWIVEGYYYEWGCDGTLHCHSSLHYPQPL